MRYFLDTEFNRFQGQLISIALAPEGDHADAFYAAIHCDVPISWSGSCATGPADQALHTG
jgi:hypothetical protein